MCERERERERERSEKDLEQVAEWMAKGTELRKLG